jgi:hypothetical protein
MTKTKYPKYLGTVSNLNTGAIDYWQELARTNEVEVIPIITEDVCMIFAPANSKYVPWDISNNVQKIEQL